MSLEENVVNLLLVALLLVFVLLMVRSSRLQRSRWQLGREQREPEQHPPEHEEREQQELVQQPEGEGLEREEAEPAPEERPQRRHVYAAKFRALVVAEMSRQATSQFDEKRLLDAKDFLHTREAVADAIEALHDDLMPLYREAVEAHLESLGAMSDEQLNDDERRILVLEQTLVCAEVGLQALKRSHLVEE